MGKEVTAVSMRGTDEIFRVEQIDEKYLAMSNVLISSKYAASLMELKLTYLALQSIQLGNFEEKGDSLYVSWEGTKIRKMLGGMTSNRFFERLNDTCKHMIGRTIGIVEPERHMFCYIPFITMAKYNEANDRKLVIRFAPEMKNFVLNLTQNFTYLLKDTMLGFASEYSFKLYEVLKSYSYYPKDYKGVRNGKFQIDIGLSELKLMMGIVNAELDAVKDVLNRSGKNPDYDKAVKVSPEKTYSIWQNFKVKVIEPAIKEINASTDINVEYQTIKSGRGGKVTGLSFNIQLLKYLKEDTKAEIVADVEQESEVIEDAPTDEERFFLMMELMNSVSRYCQLSYNEAGSIIEAAHYNIEYLREKINVLGQQKIDSDFNVVGFLIKACKEDWKPSSAAREGSGKQKTDSFHNFEERQRSAEEWKELENRLRKN